MLHNERTKAPQNRTLALTPGEFNLYGRRVVSLDSPTSPLAVENSTIQGDVADVALLLPPHFVDLLIIDPPYNLTKAFNGSTFKERSVDEYEQWLESWLPALLPVLKPTASVYICGDWRSSTAIHRVAAKYLRVRNRITWEREKGRGAKANWKNSSEDIWFCTASDRYTFNVEKVKVKRRVIAPYTHENGTPKDWEKADEGNYRLTHPSNLWTDLTVPFWSMPENTDHPTQKPEKLIAKLVLASSNEGDLVLDPFLGSGTTSVVAKKFDRRFVGIESDKMYCCLAEKRLALAETDRSIQGYAGGVFWERNSSPAQKPDHNVEPAIRQVELPLG